MALAAARKPKQAPQGAGSSPAKPRTGTPARAASASSQLDIGPPADAFEREADQVADAVVQDDAGCVPVVGVSAAVAAPIVRTKKIDAGRMRQPAEEPSAERDEEKKKKKGSGENQGEMEHVQRRSIGDATPADPAVALDLGVLRRSGGQPLDGPIRGFMESRFGIDFSDVRVHTGGRASMLARALNARAFTVGRDIVFGSGEFQPDSRGGRHLIAHELTHVLQQSSGGPPGPARSAVGQRQVIQRDVADPGAETPEDTDLPSAEDLLRAFQITRDQIHGSVLTLTQRMVELALKGPAGSRLAMLLRPLDVPVRRTLKMDDRTLDLAAASAAGGAIVTEWELDFGDHDRPPEKRRPPLNGGSGAVATEGADTEFIQVAPHSDFDALEKNASVEAEADPSLRPGSPATSPTTAASGAAPAPLSNNAGAVAIDASLEPAPVPAVTGEALPGEPGAPGAKAVAPAAAPAVPGAAPGVPGAAPGAPGAAPVVPGAPPKAKAKEPPTPRTPETDPNYRAMTERAKDRQKKQSAHGSGGGAAKAAQGAAVGPANEVASKADARQVGKMDDAPAGEFSADAFVNAVIQKLQSVDPQTLGAVDSFGPSGRLREVKAGVQGTVSQQRENAQGMIEHAATQPPSTEGIEPKPVEPLAPQAVGEAPASVAADQAMPMPRTEDDVSGMQRANVDSVNRDLSSAKITETELATSNEPTFVAALDAKHSVEADAVAGPAAFRKEEGALRADAQKQAEALATGELDAMHASRAKELGGAGATQSETKSKDEKQRQQIADQLQSIYDATKADVQKRLDALDAAVEKRFDEGASAARQSFESFVESRIAAYKDERYSGVEGKALWVIDAIRGLPDDVNQFYQEGKQRFIGDMRNVVVEIAGFVQSELAAAKDAIAAGRERVAAFVKSLPAALQSIGAEAAQAISGRFDELDGQVKDSFDALVSKVADQFKSNIDAVDAKIAEMQKASSGIFGDALKQLTGVIDEILKLKDDLVAVFAQAVAVVDSIIANPIGFLRNLAAGIAQGVQNFVKNILQHLKAGFLQWLFGQLAVAKIKLPEKIDLMGIISLVLQILGLTRENIEARARKILGDKVVDVIIKTAEFFVVLATEGPAGVLRLIEDKVGDLGSMLIDGIRSFVVEQVIRKGIEFVLSLLTPASAFIEAVRTIIDVGMFVYQKAQQLVAFVRAVTASLAAIAAGNVGQLAAAVENALASAIPVVIGFLASLVGIDDLGERIAKILETVRKPINDAIDAVLTRLRELFAGKAAPKAGEIGETLHFEAGGEQHELAFEVAGGMPALTLSSTPITGIFESELVRSAAAASEDAEKARVEGATLETQTNALGAQAKEATDAGNVEEAARLNQEIDANEERIEELLKIVLAGGLEPVSVPVDMDGEEHTLTVTPGPNASIELASEKGQPVAAEAEQAMQTLQSADTPTGPIAEFRKQERDALSSIVSDAVQKQEALRKLAGVGAPSKEEALTQTRAITREIARQLREYARNFKKQNVSLAAADLDLGGEEKPDNNPIQIGPEVLGQSMHILLTPRWLARNKGSDPSPSRRVGIPTKSATGEDLTLADVGVDRGHLLANVLGGLGSDPTNLAAIGSSTNQISMRTFEGGVRRVVEAGRPVDYTVEAKYRSPKQVTVLDTPRALDDPVPNDIVMTVSGEDPVKGAIANPPPAPGSLSLGNSVSDDARKRIILAFAVKNADPPLRKLTDNEVNKAKLG